MANQTDTPPVAASHYLGKAGETYFEYLRQGGLPRGELNARTKFARFVKPTDVVLDFGCGEGTLLRSLSCARRIGVEVNPAAQAQARENGVEVFQTLHEVPEHTADVVISNHALEHVYNPVEVLRGLRARIKPGGKFVLVVPIDDWRAQQKFDPEDRDHHLYTWTPLLLGNLLMEAGYVVKDVSVLTHAWFPRWERWVDRLPVPVFDAICWAYSSYTRRRQLVAVAEPG